MEIEYDKEIDAKYVYIKKGKIAHTKKIKDWLLFDYADNGDILGIEILDASINLISISSILGKLIGYSVVESKPLQNGYEIMETKMILENSQFTSA